MGMMYLITVVNLFFTILTWAIIIRVLLTWIPGLSPYNPVVRVLASITDPILEPARRVIPPIGMIDISPIVVLFVLQLVREFLVRFLVNLAIYM